MEPNIRGERLDENVNIFHLSLLGSSIFAIILCFLVVIYENKKDYNSNNEIYFNIKEYHDCFINNVSYDIKFNKYYYESEIKLLCNIESINFMNNIINNINNITDYTFLYENSNKTNLLLEIDKINKRYLHKRINCYSDKKKIYLTYEQNYKKQKLLLIIVFIILFSLMLFLCCVIGFVTY